MEREGEGGFWGWVKNAGWGKKNGRDGLLVYGFYICSCVFFGGGITRGFFSMIQRSRG